jgi:hypothetical protein
MSELEVGWIYAVTPAWIHDMQASAPELLSNLGSKIANAFKWYPISKKGMDFVFAAKAARQIKIITDWQKDDPDWLKFFAEIISEGWIIESFNERINLKEIIWPEPHSIEDEIGPVCTIFKDILWIDVVGFKTSKHQNLRS